MTKMFCSATILKKLIYLLLLKLFTYFAAQVLVVALRFFSYSVQTLSCGTNYLIRDRVLATGSPEKSLDLFLIFFLCEM